MTIAPAPLHAAGLASAAGGDLSRLIVARRR